MTTYQMKILDFEELREIDGDWTSADYSSILKQLDMYDASSLNDADLRDICLLGLQDLEPAEAAAIALAYKFGDALSDGQVQNFSSEVQFEKLWEHGGDMELHRRMFSVGSLLAAVNEQQFPTPDAVRVTLEVTCPDAESARQLTESTAPQIVVRLLAAGMDDDAVLKRLFADELKHGKFAEAAQILWDLDVDHPTETTVILKVTSSGYWLEPLSETKSFLWNGVVEAT